MKRLGVTAFILLVLSANSFAQHVITYGSNPAAGHYVHVNGIDMYYEVYGSGHPLLLLHGNGGSIYSMRYQIPDLARHFLVIAVDSRAQGRSSDSNAGLTFTLMASDMACLLDSLHMDSVYVVGWSDGAIIGLKLALDYPAKVAKLVSDAANFVPDSTALPEEVIEGMKHTSFAGLSFGEQLRVRMASHFPERAGLIFDKLIKLDLYHPHFTVKQLSSIEAPTLVMAGDHDVIKIGHTIKLFHSLPHSELCIVPGTSHGLLQERPALADRIIIEFLDRPYHDMK